MLKSILIAFHFEGRRGKGKFSTWYEFRVPIEVPGKAIPKFSRRELRYFLAWHLN
jgi:hypothetical protein